MKHPLALMRRMAAVLATIACLASAARAEMVVSEGWTRATVPGATTAVGYLVLTNTGTEKRKLLRIASPVCDRIMLHQSSVDSQGVSRMWPLASLELGPGETVRFAPNGKHVMFHDIQKPFEVGARIPLALQFDGGEKEVTVLLEVRQLVPDAPPDGHAHRGN